MRLGCASPKPRRHSGRTSASGKASGRCAPKRAVFDLRGLAHHAALGYHARPARAGPQANQTRAGRSRGGSSAGRASRSQCEGRGFDPHPLHQYVDKNRLSRPVFCCPESRVVAGFRAVLPVPRVPGTPPECGPVRLPFPLSSPLTLTNRPRLAPAEPLSWREVMRVSRRGVGIEDWSSNRVVRTEALKATAPRKPLPR